MQNAAALSIPHVGGKKKKKKELVSDAGIIWNMEATNVPFSLIPFHQPWLRWRLACD